MRIKRLLGIVVVTIMLCTICVLEVKANDGPVLEFGNAVFYPDTDIVGTRESYKDVYDVIFDNASEEDLEILRRCVYWEAGCCGNRECILATTCVILNRVLSEKWKGNTIKDIVYAKGQFAVKGYLWKGEPNAITDACIKEVRDNGPMVIIDKLEEVGYDFPPTAYDCFATKKQSMAHSHLWFGALNKSGNPKKGQGHWLGISKN